MGKYRGHLERSRKVRKKIIESAVIEMMQNINSEQGDFTLAPVLARILWDDEVNVTRKNRI